MAGPRYGCQDGFPGKMGELVLLRAIFAVTAYA